MPTTLETCFNNQASLPLRFDLVSSFGVITSGDEITIGYVPNICFPVKIFAFGTCGFCFN